MTIKDYSTIQRQLGIIEGATAYLDNTSAEYILSALAVIEEILGHEGVCYDIVEDATLKIALGDNI
jgi:hypothetical protein